MLVKFRSGYPFYGSSLKDIDELTFNHFTLNYKVKTLSPEAQYQYLESMEIPVISYGVANYFHELSSKHWENSQLLWSIAQSGIRAVESVLKATSRKLTYGEFEISSGGLIDQPSYKPHAYALLVEGELSKFVHGKLPKQWGEFSRLTVGQSAEIIKSKVDNYLLVPENLEEMIKVTANLKISC